MTIIEQISVNRKKTFLLFSGFFIIYAVIGYVVSLYWGNEAMYLVIAVALIMIIASLFWGDDMAVSIASGKQITNRDQAPELWDAIETAAIAAGLDMPRVFISPSNMPNAFAAGRSHSQALVCANIGLLQILDKEELEGVMAHEIAHIQNHDVRLMTYVAVLAGSIALLSYFISRMFIYGGNSNKNSNQNPIVLIVGLVAILLAPLAATIIQMSISRKREFLADAQAADLTRYPQGLASALEKLSDGNSKRSTPKRGTAATAHMYIHPLALEGKGLTGKMFSTHPPTEERINRLTDLAGGIKHQSRKRVLTPTYSKVTSSDK
jgi:heat shock protein HtpX